LMDRTRQALTRLHRSKGVVALLFIDLDRFKAVNDNFGHEAGDELLVAVAARLAQMMRDSDTIARLGGDEFVILGEDIASESEAPGRWLPDGAEQATIDELLPASFLPRAQDSELIVQIGDWVLDTACAQAAAWHRAGLPVMVSVNVAARQLTERDLAKRVRAALQRVRLPSRALCLEVSEDSVLRDPERTRSTLAETRRL